MQETHIREISIQAHYSVNFLAYPKAQYFGPKKKNDRFSISEITLCTVILLYG